MKSSIIGALLLLVSASATEFSLADWSAVLDSDDECSQNGQSLECALELAQLKVARRHKDSPEAPASSEAPAEAPAETPPAKPEAQASDGNAGDAGAAAPKD